MLVPGKRAPLEETRLKKTEFIIQDIVSKIYQGAYARNKLPTERDLASFYQVSRYTVHNALKELSTMGFVTLRHGSGIYVTATALDNPLVYNAMTRVPYSEIQNQVIYLKQRALTAKELQSFDLPEGDQVLGWEFLRRRISRFQVTELEKTVMPVVLFPHLTEQAVAGSIQQFVQSTGDLISHYITTYTTRLLTREESGYLSAKRQAPMIISNRCIWENGTVYALSKNVAINYSVTYITPFNQDSLRYRSEH